MNRILRPVAAAVLLPVLGATALALGVLSSETGVAPGPVALSDSPVAAATVTVPGPGAAVVVRQASGARGWSLSASDLGASAGVLGAGLPADVLAAYTTAVLAAPDDCHLQVSLLAALGQVESGNLVGHQLDGLHRVVPQIVGPALDGTPFDAVRDTDAGKWDGDTSWDRAVGPMHLLPDAWRLAGVDMDGDGARDPQNVYDAAGAAMVYLCAAHRDLATTTGQREAILAFNHSPDYLRVVLAWKGLFDRADVRSAEVPLTFDSWALPVSPSTSADVAVRPGRRVAATAQARTSSRTSVDATVPAAAARPLPSAPEESVAPETAAATPSGRPTRTGAPVPSPSGPTAKPDPGGGGPSKSPSATPTPLPTCPLPVGVPTVEPDPTIPVPLGTQPADPAAGEEPPVCVLAIDPATGLPYVDPATGLPQTLPTGVLPTGALPTGTLPTEASPVPAG